MILFCIGSGVRIGEVIALKIPDLDLKKEWLTFALHNYNCNVFDANGDKNYNSIRSSTKNRLSRDVPIPSNAKSIGLKQVLLLKNKILSFQIYLVVL